MDRDRSAALNFGKCRNRFENCPAEISPNQKALGRARNCRKNRILIVGKGEGSDGKPLVRCDLSDDEFEKIARIEVEAGDEAGSDKSRGV